RNHRAVDSELLLAVVDIQRLRAADARLAHAACDYRRVTRHTTTRSDDRLRRDHAVKIIRTGLLSHEYDLLPVARQLFRFIWTENYLALRRARTRRQPGREHGCIRLRIDSRMEQLIELVGR